MEKVQYVIMGEKEDGSEVELFRWTRTAAAGVTRGWKDAKAFGIEFVDIFAQPVRKV